MEKEVKGIKDSLYLTEISNKEMISKTLKARKMIAIKKRRNARKEALKYSKAIGFQSHITGHQNVKISYVNIII